MSELRRTVSALRRPALLVRAARLGATDYRRDRDLCRILKVAALPSPVAAVRKLLAEEALLDTARREGSATYSVVRHVELTIALMGEASLLPRLVDASEREACRVVEAYAIPQPKASGSASFRRAM